MIIWTKGTVFAPSQKTNLLNSEYNLDFLLGNLEKAITDLS